MLKLKIKLCKINNGDKACMHLKAKLKREETVAFVGFIISNTPDIKISGILSAKLSKCFEHLR